MTSSYRILVVDDMRRFVAADLPPITYARDSETAIAMLRTGPWNMVWLDHDLGENDDIRPVVKWIVENKPKLGHVCVQSMNPVGAQWIVDSLIGLYPGTERVNHPDLKVT